MKRLNIKKTVLVVTLTASAALLTGCGSSTGAPVATPVGALGGTGQCVPLTQPIGFTATNVKFGTVSGSYGTGNNLLGGAVPATVLASGQYINASQNGTVITTAGGATSGVYSTRPYGTQGASPDGSVVMNILPANNGAITTPGVYSGGTGLVTATGTIMLSQAKLAMVQLAFSSQASFNGGGFNGSYPSSVSLNPFTYNGSGLVGVGTANLTCATSVAFDLMVSGTTLYWGGVFLYLNTPMGTGHGTSLAF